MIMAGGKGSRLVPLTSHRAKPAVPFGGRYRIIDFVLSNFLNSGYRRIYVLTQYMAASLIKHIQRNWNLGGVDGYIELAPAQDGTPPGSVFLGPERTPGSTPLDTNLLDPAILMGADQVLFGVGVRERIRPGLYVTSRPDRNEVDLESLPEEMRRRFEALGYLSVN